MKALILALALPFLGGCILHGHGHHGHVHSTSCGHYYWRGGWHHSHHHYHGPGCGHTYIGSRWILCD